MPGLVGVSVVEAIGKPELKDKILISALQRSEDAQLNLAHGMIGAFSSKNGVSWAVEFLKRPELLKWPNEKLVVTLLLMPATRAIWEAIARFGSEIDDKYWSQIGSLLIDNDASAVRYAVEKFLGAKRSLAAIPLVGRHKKSLSSEVVIRVLTQVAREPWPKSSDTNDATMFIFWIETLLEHLDDADDVSETEIARLEWQYLAVLEHSRRPPVTLHAVMAASPEFFVKVLSAVYGPSAEEGDGQSKDVDAVRERSVAGQAFNLLRSWHKVPGLRKDGSIDSSLLEDWTRQVRRLCADGGIGPIGDEHIGKVLASSPAEADGVWPQKPVRELIETSRSREMELGILIGIQNNRGVTRRGLLDGGVQERSIAKLYRDWAKATQMEWPRTSALLEQIALNFEEHGRWHDQNAERTDWSL